MTPTALRALRQAAGLTQPAAGVLCGVDRVTVARWEAGERVPSAAQWAIYRARVALLAGDKATALAVLGEAIPPAAKTAVFGSLK